MAKLNSSIRHSITSLQTPNGVIEYSLRRSRRNSLAVSINPQAEVLVSAPNFLSDARIIDFIHKKSQWILTKVNEHKRFYGKTSKKDYVDGHEFLYLGIKYPLKIISTKNKSVSIEFANHVWNVYVPEAISDEHRRLLIKRKMIEWYRKEAQEVIGGRVFHYCRVMGLNVNKIVIKSQKRLWGSCNYVDGRLNLNWLIILAPLEVADYVVVHELSHLVVPNHSHKFWQHVSSVLPDYQNAELWLKKNTAEMTLP